jgi:hypothetical protein
MQHVEAHGIYHRMWNHTSHTTKNAECQCDFHNLGFVCMYGDTVPVSVILLQFIVLGGHTGHKTMQFARSSYLSKKSQ